jgi:hypothetical protein
VLGTLTESAAYGVGGVANSVAAPAVYTFTGTPATVSAALQALVFTPTFPDAIVSGKSAVETLSLSAKQISTNALSAGVSTTVTIRPEGRLSALNAVLTNPSLEATVFPGTTTAIVPDTTSVVTLTGVDTDPLATDVFTYNLTTGHGYPSADWAQNGKFRIGAFPLNNQLLVNVGNGLPSGTYRVLAEVNDYGGDHAIVPLTIVIGSGSTPSTVTAGAATVIVG